MSNTPAPGAPLPIRRDNAFDPPAELQRLREHDPVSRLALPDGTEGWLVTRHEDVRAILADPRFSSRRPANLSPVRRIPASLHEATPPGMFVAMDPPEHTRYRRALIRYFTTRRMRDLAVSVRQIVADQLTSMAQSPPPIDLVARFAEPVPLLVLCQLLGVPEEGRAGFLRRVTTVQRSDATEAELREARDGNRQFMLEVIRDKRHRPDDGLISTLVHGPDGAGEKFSEAELMGVCLLLLAAGHQTTANMLGLGSYALLKHPDQMRLLAEHPQRAGDAVEELLRYLTVLQFGVFRMAREDVEIRGRKIRAGEPVLLSLSAANRDARYLPDADRLDISRGPSPHVAFGHGIHQCLGQQLARVELTVALTELVTRYPRLRLAVPDSEIRLRSDMNVYGVHELPVVLGEPA